MIVAFIALVGLGEASDSDLTSKEYKLSDEQVYRIVFDHRRISSMAETLEKGFSFGKFKDIKDPKANDSSKPSLSRFYGYLAEKMERMGAQIEALTTSIQQKTLKSYEDSLIQLREEVIEAHLRSSEQREGAPDSAQGSEVPEAFKVERSWDNFRICARKARAHVFDGHGDVSLSGCLSILPQSVLPQDFRFYSWSSNRDVLLLFQDLIYFKSNPEDLVWMLPAFDSRFRSSSREVALEMWTVMRFLRRKGNSTAVAFEVMGRNLPSLLTEIKIPVVDKEPVRKDFCKRWQELFKMKEDLSPFLRGVGLCLE